MAQVYPLPTQRYAGRFIIELDPTISWSGVPGVIVASDGTGWLDYARLPVPGGNENRIISYEIADGADLPVRTLRATLHMSTDHGSLSSGAVNSPFNRLAGAFSPAIFGGRRVIVQDPLGDPASLNPTDWRPRFWGRLDDPRANSAGDVSLFARDTSALLMVPYTGDPVWIGTEGELIALDEAIQRVLDAAFGEGSWPLKSPGGDLEWAFPSFEMEGSIENVLTYIREVAQQRGAVVRWWPDPATGRFQLSLFVLQQDKATPDRVYGPGETEDIPFHGSDISTYRNDFTFEYRDEGDELHTLRRPATEAEKRSFGLQPLKITEASTSHINTAGEATVMLDSIEAALRVPATVASRQVPRNPDIEVNSLLRFAADGRVTQEPTDLYVVSWTERVAISGTRVEESTVVEMRGAPVGQIGAWLRSIEGAVFRDPEETLFQISNVIWDEGDDGYGTLSWDVGPRITDSFLGYAIVPAPESEAKWDQARDNLAPATSPVRLRMPLETAQRVEVGLLWLEARYEKPGLNGLATGDVHSMRIFPRTSIPAIDDQTGDLRDGAVKRREMIADGVITARTMREGIQTFNTDVVFSASSNTVVNWTAGRVALADGRTVSVAAGSTGPMPGPTWVYLDMGAPGSLQVTRNVASTQGDERILLAYARPIADASQLAFFVPAVGLFGVNGDAISPESIRTNHIAAGQVVANHIASVSLSVIQAVVNQLSAITADLGEVRTGLIINAAENPTRAIRLSDDDALPASAVDFLDLGATGVQPVLQVGGMRVLATGETIVIDPQIKKMRLSHHAFRPFTNNMQYGATETRTTSPDAFTEWGAAFSLPVGSRIIRVRDRAGAGENGNTVVFRLYRQDQLGNVQQIWESIIHQDFIGTGESPVLDEIVEAGYSYAFYYQTIRDQPGPGTPAFEWAEVEYEATNYRQTL